MGECQQRTVISSVVGIGNEIVSHAREVFIFRSSVWYVTESIHALLPHIKSSLSALATEGQMQSLRELQDLFMRFDAFLPHLCQDRWIQPALNWPASYVHTYIDSVREVLLSAAMSLNVDSSILNFDEERDKTNKNMDLQDLMTNVHNLLSEISIGGAVGIETQIKAKLSEIRELVPKEVNMSARVRRHPSVEILPTHSKWNMEGLLKFKALNIAEDDILVGACIGSGGFGTVFKATRCSTGEIVAVKELRTDRLTMSSRASLYVEVETMASIRHPFVLELVGAHVREPYRIITRFCPGKSLFNRLHSKAGDRCLTTTAMTKVAYQVAAGMEHLHSVNIVHRDLKTLNILLDDDDDGCVADFGLSGIVKDTRDLCGGVGTPHYTAPEVLANSRYGPKVDVFSFGVILWAMLMRKVPYGDMSGSNIYEHVVTRSWRLPIPNETPEGIKKLISRCWSKDPSDRPDFAEIVRLFTKGEVVFPGSDKLNVKEHNHKCPPLDIDYALKSIRNANDPNFASIIFCMCSNIDDRLKKRLREENLMKDLMTTDVNMDAVLILASTILDPEEFRAFLGTGGLTMFDQCVQTSDVQMKTAALQFGLKVPASELEELKPFLPQVVALLDGKTVTSFHALQFLARFAVTDLTSFKTEISEALIEVAAKVDDQQTFDAIVALLPLCRDSFDAKQMRVFCRLLTCDLVVPSEFVSVLIQANDKWLHASLILSILKANAKSDVTDVFLEFLRECSEHESEVFDQISMMQDFFPTVQALLGFGVARAPLFLLFCVAQIKDAAMRLSDHGVLLSLIQMKGHSIERLQIFTSLCMFEEFCGETTYLDGIIHLLVVSLSVKPVIEFAVRLIGAFSSHATGCQILCDNGVLELFTRLFLSSVCGDLTICHTILRNTARRCAIPQCSLIVSCLMQDMLKDSLPECEILDTLIALVGRSPGSVQEHDIERIAMNKLNSFDPVVVHLTLQLMSRCDTSLFQAMYPKLLGRICGLLQNESLMYPEIIEDCLSMIAVISKNFDISSYVEKMGLTDFVRDVIALLPPGDGHSGRFEELLHQATTVHEPIDIPAV